MNIYEKLQIMRCELQDMKLKKSGKNKFAGYEYFELQDFIPEINKLMLLRSKAYESIADVMVNACGKSPLETAEEVIEAWKSLI